MATHTEGPGAIRCAPGTHVLNADRTPTSGVPSSSPTPATGRCRSAPTFTCPTGQRGPGLRPGRCGGLPARRPLGHVAALRAGCLAVRWRSSRCGADVWSPGSRSADAPMVEISRRRTPRIYGPTTGDQVRLGDTDLWIEVEDDLTFGGEEAVFGGGKSIRESMAQSAVPRVRGCARHGHHQRGRARPLGRRQRRRGPARRPHRRARARRQPRHRRRRAPGPRDRPVHRRHLRRGQDPHRGGDRRPRPPAVALAGRTRPSPPGPPPSAAAAPAPPRARRRPR